MAHSSLLCCRRPAKREGTTEYSLFVSVTNTAAKALYERLGFTCVPYPEKGFAIPNIDYMVAT